MSTAAPSSVECTCVGPVMALRAEDIVRPAVHGSELETAQISSRARLAAKHSWWEKGTGGAAELADVVDLSVFVAAAAADAGGIYVDFSAGAPPETGTGGPGSVGPAAVRHALGVGGVVLERAGRFSSVIADLVDAVATLSGGATRAMLVSGSLPDRTIRTSGGWAGVAALAGDVTVVEAEEIAVPVGTWRKASSFAGVRTSRGGMALAIVVDELEEVDVWEHLVRKASYWPRLRADMPFDVRSPAIVYGEDDPVDFVALAMAQIAELESEETLAEAHAGARARIRPSERPAGRAMVEPSCPAEWAQAVVRGRLPGGVGRIESKDPGRSILALAGCAVFVDPHLIPLVVRLASSEIVRAADVPADCPDGDPLCVGRALDVLHPLGVIDIVDVEQITGARTS